MLITSSTVRGLILLATQDGMAEYLEAQANLTISNCVPKLGTYHVKSLWQQIKRRRKRLCFEYSFLLGVEENCLAKASYHKETKKYGNYWELDAKKVPGGEKLLQPGARKLLKRTHVFVTWTPINWLTDLPLCLPHSLKKVPTSMKLKMTHVLALWTPIDWLIDSRVCHMHSKVKGSSQNEVNLIPSVAVPVKGWPFCLKHLNTLI